jgi:hypothetical protein
LQDSFTGELGHWIRSTEALITKRADRRYLFQEEESKRRVTTPIFENAAEGPASGEDCTYKSIKIRHIKI